MSTTSLWCRNMPRHSDGSDGAGVPQFKQVWWGDAGRDGQVRKKDSLPMSESSSRFVTLRLVLHLSSSCMSSASFFGSRWISFTESRMRPKNDSSTFSMATGTPSLKLPREKCQGHADSKKNCRRAARRNHQGSGWGDAAGYYGSWSTWLLLRIF